MSEYIDRKAAQDSYRPKAGLMSPGLKRAREPYRIRNAGTGLALAAFAVGIWAWSISAVKQDAFDDVDEEARELIKARERAISSKDANVGSTAKTSGGGGVGTTGVVTVGATSVGSTGRRVDEEGSLALASDSVSPARQSPASTIVGLQSASRPRGILQRLDGRFPRLLDPEGKTLVWGAPPLDDFGKISLSKRRS